MAYQIKLLLVLLKLLLQLVKTIRLRVYVCINKQKKKIQGYKQTKPKSKIKITKCQHTKFLCVSKLKFLN